MGVNVVLDIGLDNHPVLEERACDWYTIYRETESGEGAESSVPCPPVA